MDNDIKVTVYCIAYNHEKYIKQTLDGFIMQKTSFRFEVLVHDDASTDHTADIIREYAEKYPDIIIPIIQKENLYSRNINRTYIYMLPKTNGKYIAMCEGDDYWTDPDKLQTQYDYMEEHDECSAVVHNGMTLYEETGKLEWYYHNNTKKTNFDFNDLMNGKVVFPLASLFFKKDFYIKNEEFFKKDKQFDYILKALLAAEGYIHYIDKSMCVYRKGSEGSWSQRVLNDRKAFIEHNMSAINKYSNLDKYTNERYHEIIDKELLKREYLIRLLSRDYKVLFNKKYNKCFFEKKISGKISDLKILFL